MSAAKTIPNTAIPHSFEAGFPPCGQWAFKAEGLAPVIGADGQLHIGVPKGGVPRLIPAVSCPECSGVSLLDRHRVSAWGEVRPLFVCPACQHTAALVLLAWPGNALNGYSDQEVQDPDG